METFENFIIAGNKGTLLITGPFAAGWEVNFHKTAQHEGKDVPVMGVIFGEDGEGLNGSDVGLDPLDLGVICRWVRVVFPHVHRSPALHQTA